MHFKLGAGFEVKNERFGVKLQQLGKMGKIETVKNRGKSGKKFFCIATIQGRRVKFQK